MNNTVTAKEIADALQVAVMTVTRRADREQWPFEKRSGRGGGKVYPVASLPAPVQIALRNISRPALGIIQGGKAVPAATSAPVPPAPLVAAPPEPALPPAALSKAALKADLVKAYLEAKAWGRKHGESMAKCREAFVRGYNSGAFLAPLHEQLGDTSWKSLERWALELRRGDYRCEAIAPRYGVHRQGTSKVTDAEAEGLLAILLSQSQFKIGTAITLVKMDLERQGIASPSSPTTLRNWVEAFKREYYDVWVLAREGEKALTDEVAPFLRRDASLLAVGDVLIADGHRLNFRVKHPLDVATYKLTDKSLHVYQDATCAYDDPKTKQCLTHTAKAKAVASGDTRKVTRRCEDSQQAKLQAEAELERANDGKYEGSITLEGNTRLVAGNTVALAGFGHFDGTYLIDTSRHHQEQGAGYTTEITLKRGYEDSEGDDA